MYIARPPLRHDSSIMRSVAFAEETNVDNRENYTKQWQPWEDTPTSLPERAYDELADILCKEAERGDLKWFDDTQVFDNDKHTEEVQK